MGFKEAFLYRKFMIFYVRKLSYKVFVEKIVYAELNLRETSLIYDVSLGTINKALNNGIEKFKKIVIEKNLMEGFTDI